MHKTGNIRKPAQRVMALSLMLAAGAAGGAVVAFSSTPAMAAESKQTNSPEFAKAAAPLQKVLGDVQPLLKKYAAAPEAGKPAALDAVKAALVAANAPTLLANAEVGVKTPFDRFLAGSWGALIAQVTGDMTLYQHALQNKVDSGIGTPEERAQSQVNLTKLAYENKDNAAVAKAGLPLLAANTSDDDIAELVATAFDGLGQPDQAFAALDTAINARKAAGGAVPQSWFLRANAIAYFDKLPAQGNAWVLKMAAYNPSPENLLVAESLIRDYSNFDNPESLDGLRLAWRSGAMTTNTKVSREEYKQYLDSADARRYPGEVLDVVNAGIANGALDASSISVSEPRATASKIVDADRAGLAAFAADALSPKATVKTVIAAADALLSYGQGAKAAELYQVALTKPGTADVNVLLNHLGIAQVYAGDYAGAQATLAKVDGKRKPLAQLWAIYAKSKASGK